MIFSLAACKKAKEVDVKTQDVMDSIGKQIAQDMNVSSKDELAWNEVDLLSENGAAILEMMNLDSSIMEEAVYYENPSNDKADRIIIAKVKEDRDVNTVKLAFDELKKNQETTLEEVFPEQSKEVKEGLVFVKNNYVIYLVYDDIASIKKIVDDAIVQ